MEENSQEVLGTSTERTISHAIKGLIDYIKTVKPNDRSEKDRNFAVIITDLEKVYAYSKVFVNNEE